MKKEIRNLLGVQLAQLLPPYHRGTGLNRRELHYWASAEICALLGAIGGVYTGLSRDMGRDTVEKRR